MDFEKDLNPQAQALFKKGEEIFEVVKHIADLIPDDEESPLFHVKNHMLEDAMQLKIKVLSTATSDLYDIQMEGATIIRKAARDLMVQNHSLEMFKFEESDYFYIVRDLIEEYRLLFIDWVNTFDPWNYITDTWGLFNPPGIDPSDLPPEEDE